MSRGSFEFSTKFLPARFIVLPRPHAREIGPLVEPAPFLLGLVELMDALLDALEKNMVRGGRVQGPHELRVLLWREPFLGQRCRQHHRSWPKGTGRICNPDSISEHFRERLRTATRLGPHLKVAVVPTPNIPGHFAYTPRAHKPAQPPQELEILLSHDQGHPLLDCARGRGSNTPRS